MLLDLVSESYIVQAVALVSVALLVGIWIDTRRK